MKDKHIRTRNQEIAARSRNVARLFAGRIYIRADKVFLVNGNPDPETLFKCLCSINEIPDFHKEPTPRLLGFSASDIRPVGNKELNEWSQALQKWQKISQMMEATKRHTSENKKKLEKWAIEVDHLEKRKKLLFHINSQIESSENLVTKWIPSDSGEILIDKVFTEIAPGKVMTELWRWFAMISWWIGGKSSSMRFMYALSRVCPSKENYELEHWIELIHKKLKQFQKDLKQKSKHTVFQIVIDFLESIPAEVLNQIGIKPPRRARAIEEYFNRQVPIIEKKFNDIPRIDSKNIIISIIITALDGSDVAFPSCLLIKPVKDELAFIETMLNISNNSQYEKLLGILDKIKTIGYYSSYTRNVLNLVTAGADHEDINWLYQLELYNDTIEDFSNKKLSPRSLRLITSVIKEYGDSNYSQSEVEYVIDCLISAGSTWFVDMFAEWLLMIPKKYLDKTTIRAAWNTMLSGLALSKLDISNKSIIHQWANPQEQKYKMNLTNNLSSETKKCLRDLVHYQKLLGRREIFPDSINNLLLVGHRKYLELTDLRKLREAGKLSTNANNRLLRLENELKNGAEKITVDENKIQRKAQEITARLAIEALAKIVRDKYLLHFEFELKRTPPDWLKFHEFSDIILWSKQLKDRQKEVFDELCNVWKDYGPDYKVHLSANIDWINRISKRKNKIEKWMHPKIMKCQVLGTRLTIELSNDPFRIFLMGTYFDTCLGLGSGSNRDSVLANAYDANKGVLFAIDEYGVVMARKLIAVNDNGFLIGYNTYINSSDKKVRRLIKDKITSFCANLATEAQFKLSDSSERIKSLTGIFWYDDGYERWDRKKISNFILEINEWDKFPENRIELFHVQFLAIQNKSLLKNTLSPVGLWPPPGGESILKSYKEYPEFIEEALAYAARKANNLKLIQDLVECCQTRSGKFEALIGNFIMTGNDMPEGSDFHRLESNNVLIDIALSNANNESAIPIILSRGLQHDYPGDKEILFHLLWRSPGAANNLVNFLLNQRYWFANAGELFTIFHLLKLSFKGNMPNALINKIITHYHSTNIGGIFPKLTFPMSQWLPVLNNPDSCLSLKFLFNEYNDDRYHEEFPYYQLEHQTGIIIWAMRNKCPITINFLKELSKTIPSALLAFSLISEPYRFRDFITKSALKYIKSPAALMALLNVHEKHETEEILKNAGLLADSEVITRFSQVKLLFEACQSLSWKDIGYQILNLSLNERLECLPFLIYQVQKVLSTTIDGDFGKVDTIEDINGIIDSGIDPVGLIFSLAERLRTCEDKNIQLALRRFFHEFIKQQPSYRFPTRIRLLLNIISNNKMYIDLQEPFVDNTLHFESDYDFYLINPFYFFFDSSGNRRVTADLEWVGDPEYFPTNLPDDLDQAYNYASFLKSKNVKPKFLTELQKRLFDKAGT